MIRPMHEADVQAYRALAAAIVRQAVDDLAVPTRQVAARAFLDEDLIGSIWHDWLRHFVNGGRVAQVVRLAGKRHRSPTPLRARGPRGPYGRRVPLSA